MKNNQTIKILGSILLLLAVLWALKTYLPQNDSDTKMYQDEWIKLDSTKISQVTISKNEEKLNLIKDGTLWKTGDYLVDSTMVDNLLTSLVRPAKMTVVALTSIRNGDLGIASESARILVQQGTDQQQVTLGNQGNGGRYLTIGDKETIYLVSDIPVLADSVKINDWVDKTIIAIAEDKLTKLSINNRGKVLTLVRNEGSWTEEGDTVSLDPSTFSAAISTLASMMTQGLVEKDQEKDYAASPDLSVTVERLESGPVELKFFAGKDGTLVTSSERAGKYVISTSVVDNFRIDAATLKP